MNSKFKLILTLTVITVLLVIGRYFNAHYYFKKLLDEIIILGPLGVIIFILLYVVACILFLPGLILTLSGGAIFGVVKGSVIVCAGATLGATSAFLVGRYAARGWVEKKIQGNEKFKMIDEAVAKAGWKIVALTRLCPIFPFNLINYAYGATKVSLRDYFFASWLGMIPLTILYVYIGSLAGEVATLGTDLGTKSPDSVQWAIRIIGLIATLAVTFYISRIAKKTIEKSVQ